MKKETIAAILIGAAVGLPLSIYADETRDYSSELLERPAPIAWASSENAEITQEHANVPETGPHRDDEDVDLMARVIYWEAGNQDMTGKKLVADVILNRMHDRSGIFPDTIEGVIYQSGQFAVTGLLYSEDPPEECYTAALEEMVDQVDYDILWFDVRLPAYGEYAYQHGDHYFSR